MKRLGNCGERVTASGWDTVGFSDLTSFLVRGAHGYASGTRRVTGDATGIKQGLFSQASLVNNSRSLHSRKPVCVPA
jgi:hypothetical protein